MKLLAKSVLRSSVVQHVTTGCFRGAGAVDVLVGKETTLELLSRHGCDDGEGSMETVWQQAVGGTIMDMATLPWNAALRAGGPEASCHL
jgi:hypothetical protein